mmetsp:Transcript_104591/g.207695  ORF Transcript_104591/g.207695 Transcript_104591/m.207695 type:complete len:106 (-) Transcript_104591:963-1280(-)
MSITHDRQQHRQHPVAKTGMNTMNAEKAPAWASFTQKRTMHPTTNAWRMNRPTMEPLVGSPALASSDIASNSVADLTEAHLNKFRIILSPQSTQSGENTSHQLML